MKPQPYIISGGSHEDHRGILAFNNTFDASMIKRVYTITNTMDNPSRGWQGHKIESRWFSCVLGSFKISLVAINNWKNPASDKIQVEYILKDDSLDVLYVPPGYVSCITMQENNSKLLILSNYRLGEISDEYRYDINHFK